MKDKSCFIKKLAWKVVKLFIRVRFPHVPHISTIDLATWLEESEVEKPLLLDARTSQEYAVSHLKDAKLLPAHLEELESVPMVVYCSIGYRSAIAVRQLQKLGYQKVFNLEGSIFQWANEHRLLESREISDRVHPYNRFWSFLLNDSDKN